MPPILRRPTLTWWFALACLFAAHVPASLAQDAPPSGEVSLGQRYVVHSPTLREDREVLVHLPKGYARSVQRYPVLYVLDGESHFALAVGMVDFLAVAIGMPSKR